MAGVTSEVQGYTAYPIDVPQINPAQLPFNESSGGSSAYHQRRVEELISSLYHIEGMFAMAQAMNRSMQVTVNNAKESVRDAIGFEYCIASSSGWTNIRCAPFEDWYSRNVDRLFYGQRLEEGLNPS
ncbi:hypothetical protein Tco_1286327 [Tanacetum coccineum]